MFCFYFNIICSVSFTPFLFPPGEGKSMFFKCNYLKIKEFSPPMGEMSAQLTEGFGFLCSEPCTPYLSELLHVLQKSLCAFIKVFN